MPNTYNKSHPDGFVRKRAYSHTVSSFGNTTVTSIPETSEVKTYTDTLSGVYNPAWRDQVRMVTSATTSANGVRSKAWITAYPTATWSAVHKVNPFFYSATGNAYGGPRFASGPSDYWPSPSLPDAATSVAGHNQAVSRLYSQLNNMVSSVKSGEDWGEWKQTMRALKSPMKSVRDLLTGNHYKSLQDLKRYRTPVKLADAMAATHLEYAFGWKPLADTVAKAVVGLQNREVFAFYHPFFARSKVAFAPSTSELQVAIGAYLSTKTVVTRTSEYSETYQGVWGEECKLPEKSISGVLGLWPRDFLPTVWNLIPYSFLVDYFVNVGDIVSSLAVPWGGVKWCNYTIRTTNKSTADITYILDPGAAAQNIRGVVNQTPGQIKCTVTTFNRSPTTTLPVPDLEFTRPGQITARQWVNMAALTLGFSAQYLLKLKSVVKVMPSLPQEYTKALARREKSYRDPYPFHRGSK